MSYNDCFNIPSFKLKDWERIGEGGFGSVYKAKHEDWGCVAVKKLKNHPNFNEKPACFLPEMEKHMNLRHANIVQFMGVTAAPEGAIVLEFMPHGSLDKFIEDHPGLIWPLKLMWAHQSSLGVNYLHTRDVPIIHRDLKLPNVLLGEGFVAKITDFGVSQWKAYNDRLDSNDTIGGTLSHVAPEVFCDPEMAPTTAIDMYSFAILLWELFTEEVAFSGKSRPQITKAVCDGRRPAVEKLPLELTDIIQNCWAHEPNARLTFGELKTKLENVLNAEWAAAEEAKLDLTRRVHFKTNPSSAMSVTVDGGSGATTLTQRSGSLMNSPPGGREPPSRVPDQPGSHISGHSHVQLAYPEPSQIGPRRPTSRMPVQRSSNTDVLATDLSKLCLESQRPAPESGSPDTRAACPEYGTVDLHPPNNYSITDAPLKPDASQMVLDQVRDNNASCTQFNDTVSFAKSKFNAADRICASLGPVSSPNARAALEDDVNKCAAGLQEDAVPGWDSFPMRSNSIDDSKTSKGTHSLQNTSTRDVPPPDGSRVNSKPQSEQEHNYQPQYNSVPPKKSDARSQSESLIYQKPSLDEKPNKTKLSKTVSPVSNHMVYNISNSSGPIQIGNNNVMYSGVSAPPPNWHHHNFRQPCRAPNGTVYLRQQSAPVPRDKIEVPPKVITDDVIDFLSSNVGNSWKQLAVKLNFSRGEIDSFDHDYHIDGLREKIFQVLVAWRNREAAHAKYAAIAKALIAIKRTDLARQLPHI